MFVTDLNDRMSTRLGSGSRPDPKDGIGDRHAVFSTQGIEQSHGDAEEGHAERSTASPTPQTPQQTDSVHRRPGDLQRKNKTYHIITSLTCSSLEEAVKHFGKSLFKT